MSLYVAVVCKGPNLLQSAKMDGDWNSFIGEDRDEVVNRAIKARDKWGNGYSILVGVLRYEVEVTPNFTLKEM